MSACFDSNFSLCKCTGNLAFQRNVEATKIDSLIGACATVDCHHETALGNKSQALRLVKQAATQM